MNLGWLKAKNAYLFAFLIPVLIMILIFIGRGIFPFGSETFLRTDLYHQYAPFFSEFQYKLQHGGSLLYSWDVGLGVNFAALYAYYLASPLNFLILLVPKAFVLEFMTYMIVVKVGLSGVTAAAYFRHHFKKRNLGCAFFGIFYAMSGYVAAYSWNIMWLDCIILFPLILLGMEQLMDGGSPVLYTVTLGLSILSNYYISIMICLFLVLYFFAWLCLRWEDMQFDVMVAGGRFALFSLIAGGLAAVTLLPEIFALKMTASGHVNFPSTANQYFTILDMFARHLPNVATEQGLDHWPNIYSGAMTFLLLPLYFMHRKISLREKAVYAVFLIVFYLSFSIDMLNFIWHGFHYPNSLPCRQSFIYILLVLTMCYHVYLKRRDLHARDCGKAFAIGMAVIVLSQKVVTDDAFHWSDFYVGMLFVGIYFLLLLAEKKTRGSKGLLAVVLLVVLTLETGINMAVTSVTTTSRTSYLSDNEDVRKLTELVREEDRGFYRFDKVTRKTKDDGAWMNFPSVSIFSSTAYKACSDFFKRMGMEASTNAYSITGATPLMDMLFSVKYAIFSEDPENPAERYLSYIGASGKTYLYRNEFTLPLGYFLKRGELAQWDTELGTPALMQNGLSEALGERPVLITKLGVFEGDDYTFTADIAGEYFVYVNNSKIKKVKVTTEQGSKTHDNVDRGFFLELGYLQQGEEVRVHSETSGQKIDCTAYYFDYEGLRSVYEHLNRYALQISKWGDTDISGTIEAPESGVLMTSIPYDEGWRVTVDGTEAKIEKVMDTFVGIPVTEGSHTVTLHFYPKGLRLGILMSGLSLLLLLFTIRIFGGLRLRTEERSEEKKKEGQKKKDPIITLDPAISVEEVRSGGRSRGRSRKRQEEGLREPQGENTAAREEVSGEDHGKVLRMQGRTAKEWNRAFVIPEIPKEKEIEVPDLDAMEKRTVMEKVTRIHVTELAAEAEDAVDSLEYAEDLALEEAEAETEPVFDAEEPGEAALKEDSAEPALPGEEEEEQ